MAEEENVREPFWERFKANLTFWVLWAVATLIAASVRLKVYNKERLDELVEETGGILLLWHGTTILPIYYCRNRNIHAIVSLSKDGELQHRHLQSRGLKTIRGSSNRGGTRALLEAIKLLRQKGTIAVTPDGPKGPLHSVQTGAVYMAKRAKCRMLPIGVACKPSKRAEKAWDKFLIPLPFSKAVLYFGDYLYLDPDEDDTVSGERIENAIHNANRLAEEALQ